MSYAKDFKRFDRDILDKILWDLLFVPDKLFFASTVAAAVGFTTIIKGLSNFDLEYSFVGLIVTGIGIFFEKLKIDNMK